MWLETDTRSPMRTGEHRSSSSTILKMRGSVSAVGLSGFAAIPTTAIDLPLVQRLRRSPRFWVRVPMVLRLSTARYGHAATLSSSAIF